MRIHDLNAPLLLGAFFCTLAAFAHLGCIVFGPSWYLALGAGQQMANLAEQGHWYPTMVTAFISLVLLVWALFALSGAGCIKRLPFTRFVLVCISAVLVARALLFAPLMPLFPNNTMTFWVVSSTMCFILGAIFALGTYQVWQQIKKRPQ